MLYPALDSKLILVHYNALSYLKQYHTGGYFAHITNKTWIQHGQSNMWKAKYDHNEHTRIHLGDLT